MDKYSPVDLEAILRFLLGDGPVDLLVLPELLDLQHDSETCHDLLSFMKERSNVFKVSKDDLHCYKASLAQTSSVSHESVLSPPPGDAFKSISGDDSPQVISLQDALSGGEADRSLRDVSHQEPSLEEATLSGSEGQGGQPAHLPDALQGLFSYLTRLIEAADGSIPLASLETDDCKAHFLLTGGLDDYAPEDFREDLVEYLRENSETFLLWPSSDGTNMVSLIGHTARTKSSSRWSKALRQVNCDPEAEIQED